MTQGIEIQKAWLTMMVAMMLPSLIPMLRRYRNTVGGRGEARLGELGGVTLVDTFEGRRRPVAWKTIIARHWEGGGIRD
jgi:hypothetical protein